MVDSDTKKSIYIAMLLYPTLGQIKRPTKNISAFLKRLKTVLRKFSDLHTKLYTEMADEANEAATTSNVKHPGMYGYYTILITLDKQLPEGHNLYTLKQFERAYLSLDGTAKSPKKGERIEEINEEIGINLANSYIEALGYELIKPKFTFKRIQQ